MNICVFAAGSSNLDKKYYDSAFRLGKLMALGGHRLIYGGGDRGLMGALARGAADAGGEILGVAPGFFDVPGELYRERGEFIFTETMAERKGILLTEAEAFIVCPGGLGTMDEFFEAVSLRQLGKHDKPIVLLNIDGYYDGLEAFLRTAEREGFIKCGRAELYGVLGDEEEALNYLQSHLE